jgi:ABC-type transport system substrate-binding protein
MKNKKLILGLFVIAAFMTFGFQTASEVTAASNQRQPNSYWVENQGYADQIVFKVITSDELLVQALRAGEIDMVGQFVDVSLLTSADNNDPSIGLTQTRRRGFGHVTFNAQSFPTNVRGLRQGFAYALDKTNLQQRALGGASYTADSPIVAALGVWSCEHPLADCSYPGGETYYEARPDKGNATVLASGFYDIDNDGWREFFNGTTADWNGGLVWADDRTDATYNWNGYTQKGKTFAEVAGASGTLDINDHGKTNLKSAYTTDADWIDDDAYSFDVTGSAGASIVINTVVTMSIEAFHSMGIQATASFITFSTLLSNLESGDFNAVFFAYSGMAPNPTFLQTFVSDSVLNQQRNRWYNTTYDDLYDTIETSTDFQTVLDASYEAQKIFWQEQPLVVMYNNELTTMYRKDKFEGAVTVPGTGGFGYFSMVKMHLKPEFYGNQYPDWPLGGTLYYGLPQPMGSQNTLWDNNAYTQIVMGMIEEGTAARNPEDLTWQTFSVLDGWKQTSDYADAALNVTKGTKLVWTMYDGLKWHDGTPMTIDDLVYSYQLLTPKNFTSSGIAISGNTNENNAQQFIQSPLYADSLKDVVEVKKLNATAMEVVSNKSGLFEFENLQIVIYPEHVWKDRADPINDVNSNPIGSGPYKWLSRQPGEFVILERNPDYMWAPTAHPPETTTTTTSNPSGSTSATTSEPAGQTPGFELLVAAFGIGTVSIITIRKRRN